jgi:hypothetical protein
MSTNLFVLAGQSNAEGYGIADDATMPPGIKCYPRDDLKSVKRSDLQTPQGLFWYDGELTEMTAGKGLHCTGKRFGPELAFCNLVSKSGKYVKPVAVAKVVKGSTTLKDWVPKGEMFGLLKMTLRQLYADDRVSLKGILWIQGESDAMCEDSANKYQDNLEKFIVSVRRISPDVPVIVAYIADSTVYPWRRVVWKAQKHVAENFPGVFLVESKHYPLFIDDGDGCSTHYTTLGNVMLGEAFGSIVVSKFHTDVKAKSCYSTKDSV